MPDATKKKRFRAGLMQVSGVGKILLHKERVALMNKAGRRATRALEREKVSCPTCWSEEESYEAALDGWLQNRTRKMADDETTRCPVRLIVCLGTHKDTLEQGTGKSSGADPVAFEMSLCLCVCVCASVST